MTETSGNSNATLDQPPMDFLAERIDHDSLREFRKAAFRTLNQLEKLRDWIDTPSSAGVKRGVALWALGRFKEAVPDKEGNHFW